MKAWFRKASAHMDLDEYDIASEVRVLIVLWLIVKDINKVLEMEPENKDFLALKVKLKEKVKDLNTKEVNKIRLKNMKGRAIKYIKRSLKHYKRIGNATCLFNV